MNGKKTVETSDPLKITYNVAKIRTTVENSHTSTEKPVIGLLFKPNSDRISFTINELVFDLEEYKKSNDCVYLGNVKTLSPIGKKGSKFQFWEEKPINHIYFSIYQLAMVSWGTDNFIISGTEIRYGEGEHDYTKPHADTIYPTLKAECDKSRGSTNKYNSNVAVGVPCPTQWGSNAIAASILQFLNSNWEKPIGSAITPPPPPIANPNIINNVSIIVNDFLGTL